MQRFVFVLSPPCDRSETGCVFGFMIQVIAFLLLAPF